MIISKKQIIILIILYAGLILFGCSSRIAETNNIEMVQIISGTFSMGTDTMRDSEKPVHSVTIKDFYLSSKLVTVEQFGKFVEETGYKTEAEKGEGSVVFTGKTWEMKKEINWKNPGFQQEKNSPVTCVSWNDCMEYIKWLNNKTGKTYRLPTEAEWEYVAVNGFKDDNKTDLNKYAWFEENSNNSTHPVGMKSPNAYGVYDLLGNVWEWCSDWYAPYSSKVLNNPTGPKVGKMRTNRGGAWYGTKWECIKRRGKNTPDDRGNGLGFRIAADI